MAKGANYSKLFYMTLLIRTRDLHDNTAVAVGWMEGWDQGMPSVSGGGGGVCKEGENGEPVLKINSGE